MLDQLVVCGEPGLPEALPVPYGTNGTISPDGEWLAYTPHSIDSRTWKRYRGGMQTDIWVYNLKNGERFTTYIIPEPRGSKRFGIYGAAAHLVASA
jgi:hypothetical protein